MPPKEDYSLKKIRPNIGMGRVRGSNMLTSTFDLIEEMDYLYIKIFKARGLSPNCNPIVEVKIGNYKGTTLYTENRVWEWNQAFAFKVQQIQDTIIDIKVKDVMNGIIIGCLKFTYPSDAPNRVIPDTPFAPQWYSLKDSNGVWFEAELMLSLWTGTQSDEAFSTAWHSDASGVNGLGVASTRGKVYAAPRLWYLRINVIQAQDLVPRRTETPEVFVKAVVGNIELRTKVSPDKNLNPKWGEELMFVVKAVVGNIELRTKVSPDKNLNPKWGEELMFVVADPLDEFLILTVEDITGYTEELCLGKLAIPLINVEKRSLPVIGVTQKWYNLERYVVDGEFVANFASKLQMAVCLEGGYHVFDEPVSLSSDFRPTLKPFWTGALGVFEMGILNARGLTGMKLKDGRQTTNAYCVAKYGPKWVKTRTIVDCVDPQWNEQYTWEVYDLFTVITIGVFDNMHLGRERSRGARDPLIGKLSIRLSTLQCDRIYTYAYPLFMLQPSGLKKMGELQLAMRFTCSSYFNLFWSYITPPLPKMNYAKPLSDNQIENLRHQAVFVVSRRLSRSEPPIRKEVVYSILLRGPNTWSLRKGKSNFARMKLLIDSSHNVRKWYAHVRSWKNPLNSLLIIILHIIVICKPEAAILTFFIFIFFYGVWRRWSMPKDPPCVDVTLSMADSAHPDELDEELDTFPTSREGEVLRMRYDRLRRAGGRAVAILGDLADRLERLEALFSWRDPRCTLWWLILCGLAIPMLFLVPIQVILSLLVWYFLTPPSNLTFRFGNLPKRLPPKSDILMIPSSNHYQ